MRILTLFILFSLNAASQVTIEVGDFHEIEVQDSLTYKAVKPHVDRYVHYMETNPINYEEAIRKTDAIVIVDKDRYFVSDFRNGTLYLNSRLNDKPATKEVVILQHFAMENGMPVTRKKMSHVKSLTFNITDKNEERFRRQLKRHNPYKYVVKQLEKANPLRR